MKNGYLQYIVILVLAVPAWSLAAEEAELAAIRKRGDSYVNAFNNRDAKTVAAHWTERADYVHPVAGQRTQGREAISKAFGKLFEAEKDLRLSVSVESLRLVADNLAVEDGLATVVSPKSPSEQARYTVVHVKEDGEWYRASVREVVAPPKPTPREELKSLEWLVGKWQAEDKSVQIQCVWTGNGRFLERSFAIGRVEEEPLEGVQVIGWDPVWGQIRSWTFDAEGGFGEGIWAKEDNRWVVKATAVLPDGNTGSEQRILTPVGADQFKWKSVQRQVGGHLLPSNEEIVLVRVGSK